MEESITKSKGNFKSIESANYKDIRLESLEIGITSRCNFNCSYCCAYGKEMSDLLTASDVIEIINEVPHLKRVKLSGGEVLIYFNECVKIIEYCNKNGIESQINTNGSLLNKSKIDKLNKAGLSYIHISLNHTNSKDFSRFYNVNKDIFEKIVEAIKYCTKQKSMDTIVETIIFASTEDHICDIHNFITDLGVKKHEIQLGIPIQNNWKVLTPLNDLVKIIKNLIDNKNENTDLYFSCFNANFPDNILQELKSYAENRVYFPNCIEGKRQLHIHSNGDVLICELGYPVVINNIFKGKSLRDMLKNPPEELQKFVVCHKCVKSKYYNSDTTDVS